MEIVVRVALAAVAAALWLLLWRRESWFAGCRVTWVVDAPRGWARGPAPPLRRWPHPVLYFVVQGIGWACGMAAVFAYPTISVLIGAVLAGGSGYLLFRWQGRGDAPPARPEGAGELRGAERE